MKIERGSLILKHPIYVRELFGEVSYHKASPNAGEIDFIGIGARFYSCLGTFLIEI